MVPTRIFHINHLWPCMSQIGLLRGKKICSKQWNLRRTDRWMDRLITIGHLQIGALIITLCHVWIKYGSAAWIAKIEPKKTLFTLSYITWPSHKAEISLHNLWGKCAIHKIQCAFIIIQFLKYYCNEFIKCSLHHF